MKNRDVELVHRILDGDDSAFSELVKKYQKPVHALVWRKIGDFHIAEEITQDTFLKAYQRLATLKKPQRFTSWLYVIAANNCKMWLRKKRLRTQPLEETDSAQLEKATYSRYVVEENERTTAEAQREVVKQLLAKLQESDRTVITLHYFSEMSAAEIGAFLGVSVNTIKSRLRRAQQRLKQEEPIVKEALEHFQITPHLTENIMREISSMKPAAPSGGKPLVPLAVSAATAIFIFLIMGVGSQYLARFQRPYNVNAQSETTIEIIDAPIVLDTQAMPDLRNQAGHFDTTGRSSGTGPQTSKPIVLAAAQIEKETRPSTKQQWTQASGPEKVGSVSGLLVSSWGDVYATSKIGIYRLAPDAPAWTLVSPLPPEASTDNHVIPMAERNDTLYLVFPNSVFASKDRGETWTKFGERPKGPAIGLVVTDDALYLALRDEGIFRSTDAGKQWTLLNNEVADGNILSIAAVENTVFVGTNRGLYRLHSGMWGKLLIDTTKAIHSLSVSGNNLYVGTGRDLSELGTPEGRAAYMEQAMENTNASSWEVFHSTDLGDSWTEITPTSKSHMMKIAPGVKVLVAGESILVLGLISFHSTDGGKTWTELGRDSMTILSWFPAVAVEENTFFKAGISGLTRSTDGGESWHPFMNGIVGTTIFNLMALKNELYTSTAKGVSKSSDGGESWKDIPMDSGELTLKPIEKKSSTYPLIFPKLAIADDVLYGISSTSVTRNKFYLCRLSTNGNVLVPVQGTPALGKDPSITDIKAWAGIMGQREKYLGAFAITGETFYVEYKRQLLRWKRGESEWFNTGLIDTGETSKDRASTMRGFDLAVSKETVYVGKRDGHLFQSLDSGNTWKDLTSNLPLDFKRFKAIAFAGSTVYVATDAGVLTSEDGEHWRVITDKVGTHTLIDQIAVDTTTVYGAGDEGVYRLNNRDEWEKISPEVPDSVTSFVVKGDRLYIATAQRGMFHASVEKEW